MCFEDAGSVIHRTANQACERQNRCMIYFVASERFIFCSAGGFITDQIRICAADTGRAGCFVCIHHDFVIGGFLHCIQVVIVHPLSVVMFAAGDDVAYITALYGVVSIVCHKLVGFVHVAFVVAYRSGSFVMHHHFDSFAGCIAVDFLHIEVGIRSHEIKHIVFAVAEPVFPAFVPAFNQYCIESVSGCKVNVTFHVGCVGRMFAIRFCFGVIRFTEFYAGQFVGVSP